MGRREDKCNRMELEKGSRGRGPKVLLTLRLAAASIVFAALVLAVYWTVEKGVQRRAISAVVEQVSIEIETPGFLVKKLGLKVPLRRVYQVYLGASEQDNHVRDIIEIFLDEVPKNRMVALKTSNKKGQNSWYLYPLEVCGEHYCHYDTAKLVSIPEIPAGDATEVYFSDYEIRDYYGFSVLVDYNWTKTASGDFIYASVAISDEAINPFDRAVRALESSGPPNYWSQKWHMIFDYDLLKKLEEKSDES